MSILSVDNISPIGSGTSVTVNNAATLVVNNVNVSGVSTFSDIVDVTGSNSTVRLGGGATRRLMYRSGDNDIVLEAASNFFYRQKISDTSHRWYTNGADEKLMITGAGLVGISSNTPTSPLEIHTTAGSPAWKFRINTSVSDGVGFYQRANGDFELVLRDASNNNNYIAGTSGELVFVTSTTEKVRIASDGDVGIGTFSPVERLHVHKASATGPFMYITNTSTGVSASDGIQIGYDGTNTAVFKNNEPTDLVFYAGSQNFRITSSGHVLPATNNTQDLGSTAKGWRNVYMNDLNLSNMNGDTNDVDGTQGSWTIQAGKDDLYIINRLNGKKFKIKMEEIS